MKEPTGRGRLSAFALAGQGRSRPTASELDEVASPKFASREPTPEKTPKHTPMVYRTGRHSTVSLRTDEATHAAFYDMALANGWKACETFERAVAALAAELTKSKSS